MKLDEILQSLDKRVFVAMGGGALLLTIAIAGVMVISDYRKDRSIERAEEQKMSYNMDALYSTTSEQSRFELLYPEVIEELDLSADPYRSRNFRWTEEEVARLWIDTDAADIDYFEEANHKLIWDILKNAP